MRRTGVHSHEGGPPGGEKQGMRPSELTSMLGVRCFLLPQPVCALVPASRLPPSPGISRQLCFMLLHMPNKVQWEGCTCLCSFAHTKHTDKSTQKHTISLCSCIHTHLKRPLAHETGRQEIRRGKIYTEVLRCTGSPREHTPLPQLPLAERPNPTASPQPYQHCRAMWLEFDGCHSLAQT